MSNAGRFLQRAYRSADVRLLVACLLGLLVLAVMTGPSGSASAPTSGFTGSLFHARVFPFLAIGAALWLLMTVYRRYGEDVRRVNDAVLALPRKLLPDWRFRFSGYSAILALAIVVPMVVNSYWQAVLVNQIGTFVLLALGLNVVVGFAGLLDLGYIAFYAIGAYSTAFWTGALPIQPPFHVNPFWAIPLSILAAMAAGVLLGAPTLRLRGDYLAIVTLGFGEIAQIAATNLTSITGGAQGVAHDVPHFSIHLGALKYIWGGDQLPYYYLLLAFVVIVLIAFHSLEDSRVGRAWTAIREDEVAAEASGVNVLKYKVLAFSIGASTSGFAGVLTASKIGFIDPTQFSVQQSILIVVLVVFGGMGSLVGAVAGAAILEFLPEYLSVHPHFGYQQQDLYIYLGALLVIMMIFRPAGIIPSRRRKREIGLAERGVGHADAMSAFEGPVA